MWPGRQAAKRYLPHRKIVQTKPDTACISSTPRFHSQLLTQQFPTSVISPSVKRPFVNRAIITDYLDSRPSRTARARHYTVSARQASSDMSAKSSIAVVGAAGAVGSTTSYSLILNSVASEIILSDPQTEVVRAQAEDLSDAIYQSEAMTTRVRVAKNTSEAGQCDIIIITAGAAQKKGESRTDLVGRNVEIMSKVINGLKPIREDAILLVVANPVDALTYFAQKLSGLPKNQVFGSGTFLDSARLRGILAEKLDVAPSSIEVYVLGEHGESQFPAWSSANVGGAPLDQVVSQDGLDKSAITKQTKRKAGAIIEDKGTTNFGIGAVASTICQNILSDQKVIRSVSHWREDLGVCLSLPAVIGRQGILRTIPISMSQEEKENLQSSADSLKEIIEEAEKKQ